MCLNKVEKNIGGKISLNILKFNLKNLLIYDI
jgi:hypothetical protein